MEISISVPNLADGKTIIRPTIEYNRSVVFLRKYNMTNVYNAKYSRSVVFIKEYIRSVVFTSEYNSLV
jgi:hypothetical protein